MGGGETGIFGSSATSLGDAFGGAVCRWLGWRVIWAQVSCAARIAVAVRDVADPTQLVRITGSVARVAERRRP